MTLDPFAPAVTVADLKAHLNLTTDADDALLADKIDAAKDWIQCYVGGNVFGNSPPAIREAIRQLAAHLFENREATLVGVTAQEMPFGVLSLLEPYRAWAF